MSCYPRKLRQRRFDPPGWADYQNVPQTEEVPPICDHRLYWACFFLALSIVVHVPEKSRNNHKESAYSLSEHQLLHRKKEKEWL